MKLIDKVYKLIHEYPSLFYYKDHPTMSDFEISRMSVLSHTFATLGNGDAWVDGYSCDGEVAEGQEFAWPLGWIAEGPAYGVLSYDNRQWPPERKEGHELYAYEYFFVADRPKKWPFSIYGYDFQVPEFLQKDWAEGLRDFLVFAIEYYSDKESLDGNNRKIPYQTRRKAVSHLKKMLKKANKMLE